MIKEGNAERSKNTPRRRKKNSSSISSCFWLFILFNDVPVPYRTVLLLMLLESSSFYWYSTTFKKNNNSSSLLLLLLLLMKEKIIIILLLLLYLLAWFDFIYTHEKSYLRNNLRKMHVNLSYLGEKINMIDRNKLVFHKNKKICKPIIEGEKIKACVNLSCQSGQSVQPLDWLGPGDCRLLFGLLSGQIDSHD